MRKRTHKPHGHMYDCEVCGFSYHISKIKPRWDGLWVCEADWEPRHPLDKPRQPRLERQPKRTHEDGQKAYSDVYPNGIDPATDL